MKKTYILFFISVILFSCFEDSDDNIVFASNINDFVWKGMNASYLYKQNIEDLANNRFSSSEEYTDFLNLFENPENLFESLIYQRESIDKFSFIVDDYIALQQYLSGISNSNGMEYGLRYVPGSSYDVYGYVRYVHPNTNAEENNIQRCVNSLLEQSYSNIEVIIFKEEMYLVVLIIHL